MGEDGRTTSAGMFANLNAGKPNVYDYVPDPDNRGINNAFQRSVNLRLTWQANQKNKLSFFVDDQGAVPVRDRHRDRRRPRRPPPSSIRSSGW